LLLCLSISQLGWNISMAFAPPPPLRAHDAASWASSGGWWWRGWASRITSAASPSRPVCIIARSKGGCGVAGTGIGTDTVSSHLSLNLHRALLHTPNPHNTQHTTYSHASLHARA
jgi:hypothetical protein